jgi:hypothetical protein
MTFVIICAILLTVDFFTGGKNAAERNDNTDGYRRQ